MTESRVAWKKIGMRACLAVLFAAAFWLRFYQLEELPDVLHADEAGLGYNAWSLAGYGVDRYLNENPIYPQNYYGGQSPLYTYCLVLLLKFFPVENMSLGLVRIPALIWSMLVVVCGARLLHLLFDDGRVMLAGTALMAFCPYFIMSGRFALDCNMMLGCSVLAITLLVKYLKKPTWPVLMVCGAGFALTLYSYALSYIVLAIFLPAVSLYMVYTKRLSIVKMLALAAEICVLGLPLILFVICLLLELPGFRFLGINILPIGTERMEDLGRTEFWSNAFRCIRVTLLNGPCALDAVNKYFTMYVISIPFIAIGFFWSLVDFVRSLRSRRFTNSAIFVLFALAVVITIGMAGSGDVYRANAVFICWVYFCVMGIRETVRIMRRYRRAFLTVVCAGYVFWAAVFLRYYFTMYSVADIYGYPNSLYFVPEKEAMVCANEKSEARKLYIDSFLEEYYYFYYPVSPFEREYAGKTGEGREVYASVNYYTPVETSAVYLVRKQNTEFIQKIQRTNMLYEMEEFEYYYVFLIP